MRLQVAKWGNSLAVRLPAECLRAAGLKAGDSVEAAVGRAGQITLTPAQAFSKVAFLKSVRKLRAGMPITSGTVESMRQAERY